MGKHLRQLWEEASQVALRNNMSSVEVVLEPGSLCCLCFRCRDYSQILHNDSFDIALAKTFFELPDLLVKPRWKSRRFRDPVQVCLPNLVQFAVGVALVEP